MIQNQENTEKELEIERTETKGKNLGRKKKKKKAELCYKDFTRAGEKAEQKVVMYLDSHSSF